MHWWKNDTALLGIGLLALLIGFVIGQLVPTNAYSPFVEISFYAASVFFNSAYLKRFWRHTRAARQPKGATND